MHIIFLYDNINLKKGRMYEKVVISGSAKFEKEKKWVEYFKEHNYDVIKYPRKIDQSNELIYKDVYINFYKALEEADYLFVLNEEKNGIKGYVGPQVYAEMSYIIVQNILQHKNKTIWILNEPSKEVASYNELNNFINLGWIKLFKPED